MRIYEEWLREVDDDNLHNELILMDETAKENAFYKELSFGTGGLRGILGAGTACMNQYVVARATQGLSNYIKNNYSKRDWKVAVGYDTRLMSKEFSEVVCKVLAYNSITSYVYEEPMPTPCVSFATRELNCCCGVVITASHNPSKYNGYKVYNEKGCQITNEAADLIYSEIKKSDYFFDYSQYNTNYIENIPDKVYKKYLDLVEKVKVKDVKDTSVKIVYTPLNGTGLKPVTDILKRIGYSNIILVKEQEAHDGHFPTCPKPNPEEVSAMDLGIKYAKENDADIVLATDPDCDRVSIAIKINEDYRILSANELGCLLLDYICANSSFNNGVFCKTIVTTDMAELIAQHYKLRTINVLTGFKYIGEKMDEVGDQFVFGFEESCGFLKGTFVRDKDAVIASMLICEMFANCKNEGTTLIDKLNGLYKQYGYCLNTQHSYTFEGAKGNKIISELMDSFRYEVQSIGKHKIILKKDYLQGIDNLPKSNVIKMYLDNNCSIIVRSSGTEPKLKCYFSIIQDTERQSKQVEKELADVINEFIDLKTKMISQ